MLTHAITLDYLVFFCDCEKVGFEDGVLFILWKRVETWMKKDEDYVGKLFADITK